MTDKRSAEIDRLTREHIASEMKVPAAMVSTTTDLYKKVYDEMSAKVPDDFDPDKSAPTITGQKTDNAGEPKKRIKSSAFGGNLGNVTINDSIWEPDEQKTAHTKPVNRTVRSDKSSGTFSIRGNAVDRKLHWLDLPTDSDLDKYSSINDLCKCLVGVYRKRYQQVSQQIDELKSIVDDIDKYSNYTD